MLSLNSRIADKLSSDYEIERDIIGLWCGLQRRSWTPSGKHMEGLVTDILSKVSMDIWKFTVFLHSSSIDQELDVPLKKKKLFLGSMQSESGCSKLVMVFQPLEAWINGVWELVPAKILIVAINFYFVQEFNVSQLILMQKRSTILEDRMRFCMGSPGGLSR